MSNWTIKEKSVGDLTVTIEGDVWNKAKEKATDKLVKKVEIKGFRKGQAPKKMALKLLNPQEILLNAAEEVAQEALDAGIKEHDLFLIDRPQLKVDDINEDKVVLTFVCTVKPEVTLGEYKGLKFDVEPQTVTDEELEVEINKTLEKYSELELKEGGTVENGNTAVIDFTGTLDGVEFKGGKGENHPLVIGSGSFIPGFEEQLIGVKEGEEKDVNVTFPEDYHAENLKGKAVVFKTKVNEIKEKLIPVLNEDFIKDLAIENVNTVEELKEHYRTNILNTKVDNAENDATNKLFDELVKNATVEVPEVMINNETEEMMRDYGMRLSQQGFSLEQFMQLTGQTQEVMKAQFKEDAVKRVELRLVLEQVAKVENIVVTDEDLDAEYKKIADSYSMEVEKVKELLPKTNLEYDCKLQKAMDLVKGK